MKESCKKMCVVLTACCCVNTAYPATSTVPTPEDILWADVTTITLKCRMTTLQTLYQLDGHINKIVRKCDKCKECAPTEKNDVTFTHYILEKQKILNRNEGKNKPCKNHLVCNNLCQMWDQNSLYKLRGEIRQHELLPITSIQTALLKLKEFAEKISNGKFLNVLKFVQNYIETTKYMHICQVSSEYSYEDIFLGNVEPSHNPNLSYKWPGSVIIDYNIYSQMLSLNSIIQQFDKDWRAIKTDEVLSNPYIRSLDDVFKEATKCMNYSVTNFNHKVIKKTLCTINQVIYKTENSSNLTIDDVFALASKLQELHPLLLEVAEIFENANNFDTLSMKSSNYYKSNGKTLMSVPESAMRLLPTSAVVSNIYDVYKLSKNMLKEVSNLLEYNLRDSKSLITQMLVLETCQLYSMEKSTMDSNILSSYRYGISTIEYFFTMFKKLQIATKLFSIYLDDAHQKTLLDFNNGLDSFLALAIKKKPFVNYSY